MAPKHDGFKDFVLDQLSDLRGVTCRAMFGGYGLYCGRVFFCIVHKGQLYFKTNATTAPRYRERGMKENPPSREEALRLMSEHPNLIKRPILVKGSTVIFGFDKGRYTKEVV